MVAIISGFFEVLEVHKTEEHKPVVHGPKEVKEAILEGSREASGIEVEPVEDSIKDREPTQPQLEGNDFQQALGGRLKDHCEMWRDPYTKNILKFGLT